MNHRNDPDDQQDQLSPPPGEKIADQTPADPPGGSPHLGDGQINSGQDGGEKVLILEEKNQVGNDGKLGPGQEYPHEGEGHDGPVGKDFPKLAPAHLER